MDIQKTFALSNVLLGILCRLYASSFIFTTLFEVRWVEHNTSRFDSWLAATTSSNWYANLNKTSHEVSRKEITIHSFVYFNDWEIFHDFRNITTRPGGMPNTI